MYHYSTNVKYTGPIYFETIDQRNVIRCVCARQNSFSYPWHEGLGRKPGNAMVVVNYC